MRIMGGQVLEAMVAGGVGVGGLVGANLAWPQNHLVVAPVSASTNSSGPVAYSGFSAPVTGGMSREEQDARYAAAQALANASYAQAPVYQQQQQAPAAPAPPPQLG